MNYKHKYPKFQNVYLPRGAQQANANQTQLSFYGKYGKRLFDITLALLLLPVVLPLMLIIAVSMAYTGKVIYAQNRVGRGSKKFKIYKFRTMRIDAEEYLSELCNTNLEIAREWELNQSLAQDPRITKLGGFLRRTKLDELPQILNVLAGDMSFVGPRPFLDTQSQLYNSQVDASAYYLLRPGITGPWQIDSKRDQKFIQRIVYDNEYLENCNFLSDVIIILKTAILPLKGLFT